MLEFKVAVLDVEIFVNYLLQVVAGEAADDVILVVHVDDGFRLFKSQTRALEFSVVKYRHHIAVVNKEKRKVRTCHILVPFLVKIENYFFDYTYIFGKSQYQY